MYRESSDDAGYVLKSEHWTKRSSKKLKRLQSNDNNERLKKHPIDSIEASIT